MSPLDRQVLRRACVQTLYRSLAFNGFFLGTANALGPLYITAATNLVNKGGVHALRPSR